MTEPADKEVWALYATADAIGTDTGGGRVTFHESEALRDLYGDERTLVLQYPSVSRPWGADLNASSRLLLSPELQPRHAHFYSGTFSKTIGILKARGTRVSYTAAAHDIAVSKQEHEALGIPFDYPHLTDPSQFEQYLQGYLLADEVICPSEYSAAIMRGYGCKHVRVIPHGYAPVDRIAPFPKRFTVGYLGQPGPDKGLRYLFSAWEQWAKGAKHVPDALLTIAGRGTLSLLPMVRQLVHYGSVYVRGEVAGARDLYDACSVVIQPSASEGFGIEVLEARAHGRPVICSDGAGANSYANIKVRARSVDALVGAIEVAFQAYNANGLTGLADGPTTIAGLTWDAIRARYRDVFAW